MFCYVFCSFHLVDNCVTIDLCDGILIVKDKVAWKEAKVVCQKHNGSLLNPEKKTIKELSSCPGNFQNSWIDKYAYFSQWIEIIGCHSITNNLTKVSKRSKKIIKNEPGTCAEYCSDVKYFGLKEEHCYCFNPEVWNSLTNTQQTRCNVSCYKDHYLSCGGSSLKTISVYRIEYVRFSFVEYNAVYNAVFIVRYYIQCVYFQEISSYIYFQIKLQNLSSKPTPFFKNLILYLKSMFLVKITTVLIKTFDVHHTQGKKNYLCATLNCQTIGGVDNVKLYSGSCRDEYANLCSDEKAYTVTNWIGAIENCKNKNAIPYPAESKNTFCSNKVRAAWSGVFRNVLIGSLSSVQDYYFLQIFQYPKSVTLDIIGKKKIPHISSRKCCKDMITVKARLLIHSSIYTLYVNLHIILLPFGIHNSANIRRSIANNITAILRLNNKFTENRFNCSKLIQTNSGYEEVKTNCDVLNSVVCRQIELSFLFQCVCVCVLKERERDGESKRVVICSFTMEIHLKRNFQLSVPLTSHFVSYNHNEHSASLSENAQFTTIVATKTSEETNISNKTSDDTRQSFNIGTSSRLKEHFEFRQRRSYYWNSYRFSFRSHPRFHCGSCFSEEKLKLEYEPFLFLYFAFLLNYTQPNSSFKIDNHYDNTQTSFNIGKSKH
ncbi:hypothetical protein KUTeg_023113 [Tegillarca granosa]|uniref:WSC domain-containing protein n=1 Tax=Tegillarca granosa TaxID=220873 RepID=A0ABQ9E6Y1_TEGGR|nr:hypothetical protein KUTeg_023113 [Tegillarca granosa]